MFACSARCLIIVCSETTCLHVKTCGVDLFGIGDQKGTSYMWDTLNRQSWWSKRQKIKFTSILFFIESSSSILPFLKKLSILRYCCLANLSIFVNVIFGFSFIHQKKLLFTRVRQDFGIILQFNSPERVLSIFCIVSQSTFLKPNTIVIY